MSHTPGRWKAGNNQGFWGQDCCIEADTEYGPVVICDFVHASAVEEEANKALIIAAPELLEALKMCLAAATVYATEDGQLTEAQLKIREAARAADMTPVGYVMSKARAAIARAEGEGRE